MKYLFYCFLACAFFLAGCSKKTDNIFNETVDQRLTTALNNYQTALSGAPGWKLFVYPKGLEVSQNIKVGGLTYYLKFGTNNRVTMVSDFSKVISGTPVESGFSLKALQRPSLIFDTYSYMHIPADPDPTVSISPVGNGNGGYGWGTDFNFAFTEVPVSDTMYLEGNFNKSSAVLVKATAAEMDSAFNKGRLKTIVDITKAYAASHLFLYIPATPSLNEAVGFDFNGVFISFSHLNGGVVTSQTVAYSYTTYGLHLQKLTTVGNYTFQDIYYDDVKKVFYILSGTTRIELGNSATPLISLPLTTIGTQYTRISIPPGATLPNESPLFLSLYQTASAAMLAGPYKLILNNMDYVFNATAKTMLINIYAYQGAVGPYLLQFNYSYVVDATGLFKFTKVTQNGNAALVAANMVPILNYIESDQFAVSILSTSSSLLGQMTSKQTPTFYFVGYLY